MLERTLKMYRQPLTVLTSLSTEFTVVSKTVVEA